MADIVKSGSELTVIDRTIECDKVPVMPVTVTTYAPGVTDNGTTIVSVEVPVPPDDNGRLVGLAFAPSPDGDPLTESVTVFENPFKLARDILEVPAAP